MKTLNPRSNGRSRLAPGGLRLTPAGRWRTPSVWGFTRNLLRLSALAATVWPASAQVSFTRILEGDIAKDTGTSFGCAWGDYDDDGYPDLFVANGFGSTNRLYHNNGDGSFTRILTGQIVNEPADSGAPVWGDYDNDGDLDLFVSNFGPPSRDFFYRGGDGGSFTKTIQGAWVTDSGAGVGAAWGDYDHDGFLDLFVANSTGQNNFLYRNSGDGTMARMTTPPVPTSDGESHGCAWADYDGDGYLDLFVTGGGGDREQQFRNHGDGTFTRIMTGQLVTAGGDDNGISCADYDNDGDLDLVVTGFRSSGNRLYSNDGTNGFVRVTAGPLATLRGASQNPAWGDYDNDGHLDLFIANSCERDASQGENNFLFHNEGDGTFTRVTDGAVVSDGGRSWGCGWADYDNDGDLDLFVANGAPLPPEAGFLYRNDGGTNRWLVLRLVGTASNRSAIGAKVRALATIRGTTFWQLREVSGGSGYCSQNDLRAHFGLGDAATVETIRIEWPSGIVQELGNVPANQFLTITEQQPGVTTAPHLTVALAADGEVQLTLTGQTNLRYVFEASTNLTRWTKIAVRTNLTGTVELADGAAGKLPERFYRAWAP